MTNRETNSIMLRLQMLRDFDSDVMGQLVSDISRTTAREHKDLVCQAEAIQADPLHTGIDKAWLLDLLNDDRRILDEMHHMIRELAIVALYKKVEITTQRAVGAAYPDIPPKHLSDAKKLKKHLNEKGLNIKLLPHYAAMDEVRCLSHDIKCGGIISAKLAVYPSWKKGETITDLDGIYDRLAPLCSSYLQELIDILMQKWSSEPLSPDDVFDLEDSASE